MEGGLCIIHCPFKLKLTSMLIFRILKEEELLDHTFEVERQEDRWAYTKNARKILRALQKVIFVN